ncbi:MAG TPA: hypothetical protein PLF09_04955, partial [Thiotrichales bacterium]|nr:hypothetical protein [Thiotrichales bacterium]
MERVLPPNNSKKPRNTAVKKEHSLFDDEFPIAHSASLNVDDETTHQRPIPVKPIKKPLSRWLKALIVLMLLALFAFT